MVEHIRKTGASTDEKRVAMDLADLRAGVDSGDLVVWIPTKKMVADCLTKHLTQDEETQSIRDLLRTGYMHLRYTDDGEERTLTAEQRVAEGLEVSQREAAARAVPAEMDSEDEASFSMHLPPTCYARTIGSTRGSPDGVVALSKHTGVGQAAKKTAQTTPHTPKVLQRSRPRFSKARAGQGLELGQRIMQRGRSRVRYIHE